MLLAVRRGVTQCRSLAVLPLIAELLERLERNGVPYCHWKSSTGLPLVLRGETDLDLLVAQDAARQFSAVVSELGFKRFESHPSRRFQGVEDWLGLDSSLPHLVHLHVYQRLILGEDFLKNHHLPVEDVLLRETERRNGILVPRPEIELSILAVRGLLKYRDGAYLRDALGLGRRGGLQPGIRAEVGDLLTRTTPSDVSDALDRHLPMLPRSAILEFLETVRLAPRDAQTLLRLRRQLERSLRPYARHGFLRTSVHRSFAALGRSRVVRLLDRLIARARGRPTGKRKTVAAGGRMIAVVGIDGSGKSTLVTALVRLLSWRVNVASLYLGSTRPGLISWVAQMVARDSGRGQRWLERRLGGTRGATRLARRLAVYSTGVAAVAEAADRKRRVLASRRLAGRGWIVVLDRYPLPHVVLPHRRMDAWRLRQPVATDGWLMRRLAQRERALYRDIPWPDAVIVLDVDPAVARSRKPDVGVAVDAKAQALKQWIATKPDGVVVVDAAAAPNVVEQVAAAALWKVLA